jgi:hypothetical protein
MPSRAPIGAPALTVLTGEPGLSLAAKGLAAFVLSRPPRVIRYGELFTSSADPMPMIRMAAAELIRCGLVVAVPAKGRGNRDGGGIRLCEAQPVPPA